MGISVGLVVALQINVTSLSTASVTFVSSLTLVSKYSMPSDWARSMPCSLVITLLSVRSDLFPTRITLGLFEVKSLIRVILHVCAHAYVW